jgi:hypothetical protein
MEKEMVPYELALRMKQLGFDESCLSGYSTSSENLEYYLRPLVTKDSFTVDAPLFQQAFRWFREKYDINKTIARDGSLAKEGPWAYTIVYDGIYFNDGYLTYEEAELACLEKLIEIVKQKENI